MTKTIYLLPLSLLLTGCPMDSYLGAPAPAQAAISPAATPANVVGFLARLEAARGSALSVAEKTAVTGAVQQSRSLLDSGQQRFVGTLSQLSGLDPFTLGMIFPPATQPVSQSSVVSKLEQKLGRPLGSAEEQAAKAATLLRNSSMSALRSNLAGRIGQRVGLDAALVESLLPLLGL